VTSATATFTASDVGRSITLQQAGYPQTTIGAVNLPNPTHPDLYAHITAVNSATSVTIDVPARATVSGQVLIIYNCDSNIKITGGTWAKGSALGNTFQFRRTTGLTITDLQVTSAGQPAGGNYGISVADVVGLNVQRVKLNTYSDGLHITGPIQDVTVHDLSGATGDDLVSLTTRDWASSIDALGEVYGSASNILVDGIQGSSLTGLVRLEGADTTTIRGVVLKNIFADAPSGGIIISDDDFFGANDISGVVIDTVDADNFVPTA